MWVCVGVYMCVDNAYIRMYRYRSVFRHVPIVWLSLHHIPDTRVTKMANIIMATSRGLGVEEFFKGGRHTQMHSHPGETIAKLTTRAITHIHWIKQTSTKPIHVYFLAGLCDVTRKDTDKAHWERGHWVGHYEEVTYTETTQQTVTRMIAQLHSTPTQIKEAGGIPCLCTIAPCHLSTWNHHRLEHRRTTHLIHHNHYADMQEQLHNTISKLNGHIIAHNKESNMFTPRIADPIFRKKNKNRSPRPFYNHLGRDGVHATKDTNKAWADSLRQSIDINRGGAHTTKQNTQGTPIHMLPQEMASKSPSPEDAQDVDENGEILDYMYSGPDSSDPEDMTMAESRVQ